MDKGSLAAKATKAKKPTKKIKRPLRAARSAKQKKPEVVAAPPAVTTAYKGFDKKLQCRGFQYEIGKTYQHTGPVVHCAAGGFHSCESPFDVLNYYAHENGNRFAVVEVGGKISRDIEDSKIASGEITIKAELKFPELLAKGAAWIMALTKAATKDKATTGDSSHAATTGYRSHAATTGDSSHAATTDYSSHAATTGDSSHAATTGDRSHAATTGYTSHAATTGYRSHAATTGDRSHAATTGDSSHAATTGDSSIASAHGIESTASAKDGAITLTRWEVVNYRWKLVAIFSSMVGENGIEAGKSYRLGNDNKPVEVK